MKLVETLQDLHPELVVEKKSFAGPLKEGLAYMGITKQMTPEAYRKAAQFIGTECARGMDLNHWVNIFRQHLRLEGDTMADIVVIDDVRFPNEAAICTYLFFIEPTFAPENLGDRAGHESEGWNLRKEGPVSIIKNIYNKPMEAIQEILESISDEYIPS